MGATVTVGIDIGTTSVKGIAADSEGEVVGRVRLPHSCLSPTPDRLEHDATIAWVDGVRRAWDELAADRDVRGGCVAAMVPSLAAVDSDGQPISAGLLYGDERGAAPDATSSPVESGEFARFARWAAETHPEAAGLWPAQAVANQALCGRGAIDTGTAMTTLPLFDGSGWSDAECAAVGVVPAQLPDLVPGAEPIGDVGGAPLAGGTIDAFAQQLVAGADQPGDVLVILGATLITWCVTSEWTELPGWWTIPHSAPGLSLVGGPSNAGALFVDRVQELVGASAGTEARLEPGRVPSWLPYIRGERVPLHDPTRRASLHDLDRTHGPAVVLRAAYEASGFVARRAIADAGGATRIVATGGGTRNPAWIQALADTTQLPVDVALVPEGGALGAAFLGRVCAGLEADTTGAARWARSSHTVEPDPRSTGAVADRYERFLELTG